MAASEQPGSVRSFKQHYSSGAGICMPFGQSTWHCYVHVNMLSHAVRLPQQHQCCTKLFILCRHYFLLNELIVCWRSNSCKFKMAGAKEEQAACGGYRQLLTRAVQSSCGIITPVQGRRQAWISPKWNRWSNATAGMRRKHFIHHFPQVEVCLRISQRGPFVCVFISGGFPCRQVNNRTHAKNSESYSRFTSPNSEPLPQPQHSGCCFIILLL